MFSETIAGSHRPSDKALIRCGQQAEAPGIEHVAVASVGLKQQARFAAEIVTGLCLAPCAQLRMTTPEKNRGRLLRRGVAGYGRNQAPEDRAMRPGRSEAA
jgi:hypothetical protein